MDVRALVVVEEGAEEGEETSEGPLKDLLKAPSDRGKQPMAQISAAPYASSHFSQDEDAAALMSLNQQ